MPNIKIKGMRQKWAILFDSLGLVQAQNYGGPTCQADLTHAKY
jgi:hypothetical protein